MRQCGSCTLCCTLVPVNEGLFDANGVNRRPFFQKLAFTKCDHQCSKGCRIYSYRPEGCRTWSCMWLVLPEAKLLPRPDRSRLVVDMHLDYITVDDPEGEPQHVPCLQVWQDPAYPEAHRAPAFRAFLALMGERHGMAALIRVKGTDHDNQNAASLVVWPPALTQDGWHEITATLGEAEHTPLKKSEVLHKAGLLITAEYTADE